MSSLRSPSRTVQANSGRPPSTLMSHHKSRACRTTFEEIKISPLAKPSTQQIGRSATKTTRAKSGRQDFPAPPHSRRRPSNNSYTPPSLRLGRQQTPLPTPAPCRSGTPSRLTPLYSNGLAPTSTSGKYDLARQEFQDYLRVLRRQPISPSNAQFYLGENRVFTAQL